LQKSLLRQQDRNSFHIFLY